ncbi:MAG: hypothetical protein HKN35_09310 [Woeseia sp.]|nr:hypothetical protein [Woeseia sp.]MBT8095935.1 hypothetical protein [Woeseia sp.]NNE61081.1 hypothetical protein [Woeseia sp.]NNL53761.1 hypothetical protein [Woeseia sp.]
MNAPVNTNLNELLAASIDNVGREYADRDVMLYALGIGFGQHPSDKREIDFIYDGRGLKTIPTMAGLLVDSEFLAKHELDLTRVSLAEQKLDLYRPLPAAAELQCDSRVAQVLDHGKQAGLSIIVESEARMTRDSTVLFTLSRTLVTEPGNLRGPEGAGPTPHALPARDADLTCELSGSPTLPYLFRLSGDRDARYVEDAVARSQGLPRAPLPEQCVAGISCRAILKTICEYDATLIAGYDLCFKGALFPNETLVTEMWQDRNIVSFRCSVPQRNATIIDNGKCTLAV